jgi:BirA family biotin operon repressor/biotin-[acetyl-CoA-carboxylase] ligase
VDPPDSSAELSQTFLTSLCGPGRLIRRALWLDEVDSTQAEANRRVAREGPGLLIAAARQERGRGRQGRHWFSPPGGLWMSLVLSPDRPRSEWPLVTSLAALAVRDSLGQVARIASGLKWPNDVHVRGRKIAGVLAECATSGPIVLGIGVNVARPASGWPIELAGRATSIEEETGAPGSVRDLLASLLGALERRMALFESRGPEALRADLRAAALLLGRRVVLDRAIQAAGLELAVDGTGANRENSPGARILAGRVVDIGPLGELVLASDEAAAGDPPGGPRLSIAVGEIVAVDPPLV